MDLVLSLQSPNLSHYPLNLMYLIASIISYLSSLMLEIFFISLLFHEGSNKPFNQTYWNTYIACCSIFIHLLVILETMITWWDFSTNSSIVYIIYFSHYWFTDDYYLDNSNHPCNRQNYIIFIRRGIIILFIFYLPILDLVTKIQPLLFTPSMN